MLGGNQRFESFFVNAGTIECDDPILCIQALFISRRAGPHTSDQDQFPILRQIGAEKTFLRRKYARSRSNQLAHAMASLFQMKSSGIQGLVVGDYKIVASPDVARKELIETRARRQFTSFLKIRRRVVSTFLKKFGIK